jgi:hypothetical protein
MAQFQGKRVPFVRERQGGNEWHLAGSASTSFAVSLLATPVCIVHEQQATQGSFVVSIFQALRRIKWI